jgi:cation diffusion facilitator family transporter
LVIGWAGHLSGVKFSVLVALAANLGVALAKFVAFLFTGSSAMLAEAAHSVADTGNQVLLLRGGSRSQQPADAEHPFGFGRFRFFNAFLVSVGIFLLGGVFALYEGVHRVLNPTPVKDPVWAIGVLLFAAVLEGFSLRTAISRSKSLRADRGWLQFIRTTKTPDLAVLLLEDFGALTGLGLALLGVGVSILTGDGRYDGLGTIAIGVLLVGIAALLGQETRSLLIGEAASARTVRQIEQALNAPDRVAAVSGVRTLHLSPDELLVVGLLEFDVDRTATEVVAAIEEAEGRVRHAVRYECQIYLQPRLPDRQQRDLPASAPGLGADPGRPD